MIRKAAYAAVLAGAVGVPYAMWNGEDVMQSAGDWFSGEENTGDESPLTTPSSQPTSFTSGAPGASQPGQYYDPTAYGPDLSASPTVSMDASGQWIAAQPSPTGQAPTGATLTGPTVNGPTTMALAEYLRMDITHGWVTQRFSRVTTTLADGSYDGLRVPLVTGTSPTALTGSLTYYFDRVSHATPAIRKAEVSWRGTLYEGLDEEHQQHVPHSTCQRPARGGD